VSLRNVTDNRKLLASGYETPRLDEKGKPGGFRMGVLSWRQHCDNARGSVMLVTTDNVRQLWVLSLVLKIVIQKPMRTVQTVTLSEDGLICERGRRGASEW